MASFTFDTRISLIKAGRIINNKIIISLVFIWVALAIGFVFLFLNNTDAVLQPSENKIPAFTTAQEDKQNEDGAFVFVVRNKQMILTRYKGFIEKGKENVNASKPAVIKANSQKDSAAVVLRQKHIQKKQPDFSVKKVPVQ